MSQTSPDVESAAAEIATQHRATNHGGAARSVEPPRDRPARVVAVAALLTVVAFVVQWPYFQGYHAEDDIEHLDAIGHVVAGDATLGEFLVTPHNEHLIPVWKAWYFATWRWAGLSLVPWHVGTTLFHAASAVFLYLLLRRYLEGRAMALVGATLWSGAAIGGWDNPLLFIGASHLTLGFMWILAAMWCVSGFHSPRHALWLAGMVVAMCLAVLSMGAMWGLTPVLVAQCWLLERRTDDARRRQFTWLASWLVVFVGLGAIVVYLAAGYDDAAGKPATLAQAPEVLLRSSAEFAIVLANLFFANFVRLDALNFLLAGATGAVLIAVVFWVAKGRRPALLVFLGLCGVYTVLVHAVRVGWSPVQVLTWGRYAYVPTLWWCVAIAACAETWIAASTGRRKTAKYVALLSVAGVALVHQMQLARAAMDEFQTALRARHETFQRFSEALHAWAEAGAARGRPYPMVNFIVPLSREEVSLRAFAALIPTEVDRGIVILPGNEYRADDERDTKQLLSQGDRIWLDMTDQNAKIIRVLDGLSAYAARAGRTVRLPEIPVQLKTQVDKLSPEATGSPAGKETVVATYAVFEVPLSELAATLFFEGLDGVEIVALDDMSQTDRAAAIAALRSLELPLADQWADAMSQEPSAPFGP